MDVLSNLAGHEEVEVCLCEGDELRCQCGSLLARVTSKGIELKCRRCKRILLIPLSMANYSNSREKK